MLQNSELMLLISLVDTISTPEDRIESRLLMTLESLLQKNLVKITKEGIVYPSKKGKLVVSLAKCKNDFRRMLPMMSYKMIGNLWHRLIEYSASSGFHMNVVVKNLRPQELDYLLNQLEEAQHKKAMITETIKLIPVNEGNTQQPERDS